jgi:hypothetical protein
MTEYCVTVTYADTGQRVQSCGFKVPGRPPLRELEVAERIAQDWVNGRDNYDIQVLERESPDEGWQLHHMVQVGK